MKTILIPTDFSATANNAANYAVGVALQTGAERLIFYHTYETPVNIGSDVMVPIDFIDPLDIQKTADEYLKKLQKRYETEAPTLDISVIAEMNALVDGINDVVTREKVDLIIMGITGGGLVEEKIIGSNCLSVAKSVIVPVIIVQENAPFTTIEQILLISDMKDIEDSIPIPMIKRVFDATLARLAVLNVNENADDHHKKYPSEILEGAQTLESLFGEYNPQYDYINGTDFSKAVNDYALKIGAQLILVIPKKHGWFESLFRESHTKQLAFRSEVPLLVMHK